MPTGYMLAERPSGSEGLVFDCARCGIETLKRPVFLRTPEGAVKAYGSGCAAECMGWPRDAYTRAKLERRLHEIRERRLGDLRRAERDARERGDTAAQRAALVEFAELTGDEGARRAAEAVGGNPGGGTVSSMAEQRDFEVRFENPDGTLTWWGPYTREEAARLIERGRAARDQPGTLDAAAVARLALDQGQIVTVTDARAERNDRGAYRGNPTPEDQALHETLAVVADWLVYEAGVVEDAAEGIEDPETAEAAEDQAESMEDAAEAVEEAAEAARETAQEVFAEGDGSAAVDQPGPAGEAVTGNPAFPSAAPSPNVAPLVSGNPAFPSAAPSPNVAPVVSGNPGAGAAFGEFASWEDCVSQAREQGKRNPEAYCAAIRNAVTGNPGGPGDVEWLRVRRDAQRWARAQGSDYFDSVAFARWFADHYGSMEQAEEGARAWAGLQAGLLERPHPWERFTQDRPPENWLTKPRRIGLWQ